MTTTIRTQADIDALPAVCGDIIVKMGGDITLPKLEKAGNISAPTAKTITLPKLEKAGNISARTAKTISLPKLVEAGYIYARAATTFTMPNLVEAGYIDAERDMFCCGEPIWPKGKYPYRAEFSMSCGWVIVDPDGRESTLGYVNEKQARDVAEKMTYAYWQGAYAHGATRRVVVPGTSEISEQGQ